jgi:exopolysaccharide production protein ExoY
MFSDRDDLPGKGAVDYSIPIKDFSSEKDFFSDTVGKLFKLLFDRLFALSAVLFLLPVFIVIATVIYFTEGRPIFYKHRRVGLNGNHFGCLKFRTMSPDADARLAELLETDAEAREEWQLHHKLTNDPRVSCIGKILRTSSLDELPQFFNVLTGDMSVVGPRPICDDEIADYGDAFSIYTRMKPGITGAWQVCGRSSTTFEERVEIDTNYYAERGFLTDLKIIAKTLPAVFSSKGAS